MAWNDRIDPFTRLPSKHDGIDLPFGENAPLGAMRGGVVKNIANDPKGYGWFADILHDDGTTGRYAHANVINKGVGQRIENGEELGLVGSTGRSTGAHLHFEHHNQLGKPIDPNPLVASSGAPFPSSNIGGPKMGSSLPLSTGEDLYRRAIAEVNADPVVDPRLGQMMAQQQQSRAQNLPMSLGAMLSRDKGVQRFGNAVHQDASQAQGLSPLGDVGFIDSNTGDFIRSPVGQAKQKERVLEMTMRLGEMNQQRELAAQTARVAATASADQRAQTNAIQQGQLSRQIQHDETTAAAARVEAERKEGVAAAARVLSDKKAAEDGAIDAMVASGRADGYASPFQNSADYAKQSVSLNTEMNKQYKAQDDHLASLTGRQAQMDRFGSLNATNSTGGLYDEYLANSPSMHNASKGEMIQIQNALGMASAPSGQGAVSNYERKLYSNANVGLQFQPDTNNAAIANNRLLVAAQKERAAYSREFGAKYGHLNGVSDYVNKRMDAAHPEVGAGGAGATPGFNAADYVQRDGKWFRR